MKASTPYDGIWIWLAFSTNGFAVTSLVFLRSERLSLFPDDDALVQDDAMFTAAYCGACLCLLGLQSLGTVAFQYCVKHPTSPSYPWSRLLNIEIDRRDAFVARLGLGIADYHGGIPMVLTIVRL